MVQVRAERLLLAAARVRLLRIDLPVLARQGGLDYLIPKRQNCYKTDPYLLDAVGYFESPMGPRDEAQNAFKPSDGGAGPILGRFLSVTRTYLVDHVGGRALGLRAHLLFAVRAISNALIQVLLGGDLVALPAEVDRRVLLVQHVRLLGRLRVRPAISRLRDGHAGLLGFLRGAQVLLGH